MSTPSAAGEGTSSAAGCEGDIPEGSKNPTVRLVPFQSMPKSTQEELGKELFDDPLLSVENMKKLADSMHRCFKYTFLCCCLYASSSLVTSNQSCLV